MDRHRYHAFGLRIESARLISPLVVEDATFVEEADVEISEGEVRLPEGMETIQGVNVKVVGDSYFLDIEECGQFQIIGGRQIIVQPDTRATADQVNLFLLGSVLGTLMHQRGILPFHCNAVEIEGSTFLFCGESGAGKSTLAAYFVDRGFRLLSDDLCALHFHDDGRIMAAPGIPRLKLWHDTLEAFGRSTAGLKTVPWYDDKFELALTGTRPVESLPVAALYQLRSAENERASGIHGIRGLNAANAITANIYRRRFADLAGAAPFYLTATAQLIEQIPIFALNRRWGFEHFHDDALMAEKHMHQLLQEGTSLRHERSKSTHSQAPLRG